MTLIPIALGLIAIGLALSALYRVRRAARLANQAKQVIEDAIKSRQEYRFQIPPEGR